MSDKIKQFWTDYGLGAIVIIVLAIIFSVLSQVISPFSNTKNIEWENILLTTGAFVLIIILSVITVFVMYCFVLYRRDKEIKNIFAQHNSIFERHNALCDQCQLHDGIWTSNTNKLNTFIDKIKIHDSIISHFDLAVLERDVEQNKTIYIFTSEFTLEESESFKKIMKNNFAKNITYKYIIPKSAETRFIQKARGWNKENSNVKENNLLECYKIPDDYIFMTVAVYDASNITEASVILKVSGGEDKFDTYPYVCKFIDNNEKQHIITKLENLICTKNKVSLWD